MGSREQIPRFCVFDGVKVFPATPETLMAEINSAIANYEYAYATAVLNNAPSPQSRNNSSYKLDMAAMGKYDAGVADEAYKAGCAALAAGKLDEALTSLSVALSKCPPEKTTAVVKLQSLISLTAQQLKRSPKVTRD